MATLNELEMTAMRQGVYVTPLNLRSPEEWRLYSIRCAVDAIAYYIETDRAWGDWRKAFSRANTEDLLEYVISSGCLTDIEYIERTTAYLRRHCGL